VAFEFNFNETFRWCALYLAKGLRIIRLHGIQPDGRCTCGDPECRVGGSKQKSCGKHPVGGDWGDRWARSEDDLLDWDDGVPFNVGVLLGPDGGVIDNEDDSPEATAFRESLGLHELITPSWTSGKSTHQLTRWHDSLAGCGGVQKPGGLECRLGAGGRQIQSVLPPSWHNTGVQYRWKADLSIDDVEIADTPRMLVIQITNVAAAGGSAGSNSSGRKYQGPLVFREVHDGQGRHEALLMWAWNKIVNDQGPLAPERRAVLTQEVLDANEKYIKPPKSRDDALQIINSCFEHYRRKQERGWRHSPADMTEEAIKAEATKVEETIKPEEAVPVVGLEAHGLEAYQAGETRGYRVGSWKIEMIQGDPPEIVLVVPQWKLTACGGRVSMTLDTFRSAPKVAAAVFNATRRVILDGDSKRWMAAWKGVDASKKTGGVSVPGVMEQLMSRKTAEDDIKVGTSSLRYAELAGYLLKSFSRATKPRDEEKPEPNESGRPCWVTPDELWFGWGKVWEEISSSHDVGVGERNKVRNKLLEIMGAKDLVHKRHRFGSGRLEYVVFTHEWVAALQSLAAGEDGRSPYKGDSESNFAENENHSPSTVHESEVGCV
jgi:hypothetical protein